MTKQVKRPARLDITDMPRDTTRALGGLRQALCSSFNYCRQYPAKMAVLKDVLKYTYNRIVQYEKEVAEAKEQAEKVRLELEASKYGVDLDKRKSVEDLTKALEEAKAAFEAKAEAEAKEAAKATQDAAVEAEKASTDDKSAEVKAV